MSEAREILFARPWITDEDRQAVLEVLNGHILTHGPQGKAFEEEFAAFLGSGAHCVSVSSCMAALHLAYLHYGIGRGDEVIVPAQTHTATAHAVEWVGARPIFVDCDPRTGNLTADSIAKAITPRTKAISVVHFVGIPCAMPEIAALAERHGLKLIEDCAIALGSRYEGRHVGLFGDAGCFSFYPVKHLTTGEGGMFVSRHAPVAEKVAKLRAFGVDRKHSERSIPGMYDVPALGLNYRMSEMAAALGRSQLRRLERNLAIRKENFARLKNGLAAAPNLQILDSEGNGVVSSHYCLSVVLEGRPTEVRNRLVTKLNLAGVGTSVYYPQPVPRLAYYRNKYGYDRQACCSAEVISDRSIALPVGPHLTGADIDHVAQTFVRIVKEETNV
ncbi:MAG: DegT/DnrJ/EryC1/StrS family aminotransferase [Verrucomicrobia bacterium]|nr:DegT/DnrJ/EryC1/StrS family aminotransferase [Verrucomicrobiota bacterium]